MNETYGEIAALTTALSWAFGSILFTLSGSRIGSANVNRGRLILAAILLSAAHFVLTGSPVPFEATPQRWFWMGLSGIVGFVIGDSMLFEAFVIIGPRLSMLLMSLVPIMSALLGWLLFGESLSAIEVSAIAVTIVGISWVAADKSKADPGQKRLARGIALGIGGAFGQAIGLLLSKKGLEGDFPALSGNIIRVLCAVLVLWLIASLNGKVRGTINSYRDKKAVLTMCGGAFFGPFVGVWLSLVSIQNAKLGIATTFMSLTPIFLIPLSRIVFGEKITIGAILGTLIAITGVAVLILVG